MTQSTPLVSVIVPAHNAGDYLGECVDSVRSQTLADWELILVDDASDDATGAMCDAFAAADSRISAHHIVARHQSVARNFGTARAKGRYICYLDSDDAYCRSALELMAAAMEQQGADMCIAGYVDGQSNTLPDAPQPRWTVCDGRSALMNILYQRPGWHCAVWARMFTRSIISQAGALDENLLYEDLEIAPRHCMAARRVAMTAAPLYFYRTNPSSFMNTWHGRRLHSLTVVDRIASGFASDRQLAAAACSRRFSAYCNIMGLAARNGDMETASRCWPVVKSLRGKILADAETRLKNKAGALMAFMGRGACTALMKWLGK